MQKLKPTEKASVSEEISISASKVEKEGTKTVPKGLFEKIIPDTPEKEFEDMTLEEKRVAVAKDVILRINMGNIKPKQGVYVGSIAGNGFGEEALVSIGLKKKVCQACAKGSLFISCIGFGEGDVSEGTAGNDPSEGIEDIFDRDQLDLIEHAFEKWHNEEDGEAEPDMGYAGEWGRKFSTADKRLKAICKNIIANNGTFMPE